MNSRQHFETIGTAALKQDPDEEYAVVIEFPGSVQIEDEDDASREASGMEITPLQSGAVIALCTFVFYLVAFI